MSTPKTLTGDDSIKTWLEHPVGGPIIRDLLAQAGQNARCDEARAAPRDQAAGEAQQGPVQPADGRRPGCARRCRRRAGGRGGCPCRRRRRDEADAADAIPEVERPEWVERIDQGRFSGKTIIVTGAGSGIGRATASRIAREGGRVVAVDVSQERLDEFAGEHEGADIVTLVADITDDAKVAEIVAAAGDASTASRTSPGSWTT